MKNKKQIIFSIAFVLVLAVIAISVSYAAFVYTKEGTQVNSITNGTITFTYNEVSNGINLSNAKPMTDNAGKAILEKDEDGTGQGYFDFNVTANMSGAINITYEVYATISDDSNMDSHFVKVYLTGRDESSNEFTLSGYDSEVPVFSNLVAATSEDNAKKLYSGVITSSDQVDNFRLRLWMSSEATSLQAGKTFNIKINVKAVG